MADCVTRPISLKLLSNTNYSSGPDRLYENMGDFVVTIPNSICKPVGEVATKRDEETGEALSLTNCGVEVEPQTHGHLIPWSKYFSFAFLAGVLSSIFKLISNIKLKLRANAGITTGPGVEQGNFEHLPLIE